MSAAPAAPVAGTYSPASGRVTGGAGHIPYTTTDSTWGELP